MSHRKYEFVQYKTPSIYDEKTFLKPMNYYQICSFPNPKTHKYEIRNVYVNEYDEITKYSTIHLTYNDYQRLLRALRDNKYRLYATYTLSYINLPSCGDISLARSEMLNIDNDYSGYAQFNGGKEFDWRGRVP
jgi:hypothetical protein